MKKTVLFLLFCIMAESILAQIITTNILGCAIVSCNARTRSIMGMNFESPATTNGASLTLSSLLSASGFKDFDNIQFAVANSNGITFQYTNYYYLSSAIANPPGWYASNLVTYAGNTPLPVGSSAWIAFNNAQTITCSGQVRPTSTSFSFQPATSNMMASAYPIPFNPNTNCSWTGLQNGDSIQVGSVNTNGILQLTQYTYQTTGNGGNGGAGWYDTNANYVSAPIAPIGAGFWVWTQGSASLMQMSPFGF